MNLIDFFDTVFGSYPDLTALIFEGRKMTYRELNEFATQTAHGLISLDVERETMWAVLSRNDPMAMVVLLGILTTRGAWTPLHTADGEECLLETVELFGVEVLVCQKEFKRVARARS